ncbi:hypothetical protein Mgra_00009046, partial [Meloidogyne graminicola]
MTLILNQHKIKVLESKDGGRPRIKSKIEEDEDFNKLKIKIDNYIVQMKFDKYLEDKGINMKKIKQLEL